MQLLHHPGKPLDIDNASVTAPTTIEVRTKKDKHPSVRMRFENFLLSRFYGTEHFHSRFKQNIDERVSEQMKHFDALPSAIFDAVTKTTLRKSIEYHERRIAGLSIWWDAVAHFFLHFIITQVISRLYYVVALGALASAANPKGPTSWWYWSYVIVINAFVFWLQSFKNRLANSAADRLRIKALLSSEAFLVIVYGVSCYRISVWERRGHVSHFFDATLSGLRQGFYSSLLDFAGSFALIVSAFLFIRWRNSKYPDSVIVKDLLLIVSSVINSPDQWTNLVHKRDIVNSMEEVASCYEKVTIQVRCIALGKSSARSAVPSRRVKHDDLA